MWYYKTSWNLFRLINEFKVYTSIHNVHYWWWWWWSWWWWNHVNPVFLQGVTLNTLMLIEEQIFYSHSIPSENFKNTSESCFSNYTLPTCPINVKHPLGSGGSGYSQSRPMKVTKRWDELIPSSGGRLLPGVFSPSENYYPKQIP